MVIKGLKTINIYYDRHWGRAASGEPRGRVDDLPDYLIFHLSGRESEAKSMHVEYPVLVLDKVVKLQLISCLNDPMLRPGHRAHLCEKYDFFYMHAAPSTPMILPLTHSPSWEARKAVTLATSMG